MKRYAVANNKHMGDLYDPSKPSSYIIYLDANNLYGWSMQQNLPYAEFRWIPDETVDYINNDDDTLYPKVKIRNFLEDLKKEGKSAFLEVKLEYPGTLHDEDNLYPVAPEKSTVSMQDTSFFLRDLNETTSTKVDGKTPMLLQTLRDKDHYFLHAKNLILYMEHGLIFKKLYSGITFKEGPLMKAYIDKNTELRNKGTSVFEKELYKLLNNSIYGKTFENPMKYSYLKFVNGTKEFNRVVSMTGFKGAVFTQDEFMLAKILYQDIRYNKPLYLGATVTEFAKYLMFNFYYNVLKDFYIGTDAVQLLFTDTDSLMLQIFTDDIFDDIKKINSIPEYECPIDCSSFDPKVVEEYGIPHHNDKVIGKFKSETGSKIIYRFVGLRSKMYAYQTVDEYKAQLENGDYSCHKRGKGIPSASLNSLTIKSYLTCLFGTDDEKIIDEILEGKRLPVLNNPELIRQEISATGIRSFDHKIYSIRNNKFGLSCNDTKRYILPNNIDSLAYGHYKIRSLYSRAYNTCNEEEEDEFEKFIREGEEKLLN